MDKMFTVAKREFRSYFDSPLAYVVICLSFVGLGIMLFGVNDFWQVDRATMQPLFQVVPGGLALLVVPVVTMRLMAEERRSGTLEMLITLPLKDSDVILGKYLGALGLVLVVVLGSLVYPVMMFSFPWSLGPLDMGPIVSGYLGLCLYAAASVAVGLLISSLTSSQAISFFLTFAVLGLGLLSGVLADKMAGWGWLADVIDFVSFQTRMKGFMRGLIDTRDVVFFLSITLLSLVVSFRALERRKWA